METTIEALRLATEIIALAAAVVGLASGIVGLRSKSERDDARRKRKGR